MSPGAVVILFGWLLAQAASPEPPAQPGAELVPAPAAEPASEPPPPIFVPPEPPIYGDAGTSEVSLALGYSSVSGFLAGGGFRRFVLPGVAPGLEATVQSGAGQTLGLVLGTVRLVPLRTRQLSLVLTGRAGRVLLSDHDDGWGAGGGAGVIVALGANVGIELGYDVLWLLPSSFCRDLSSCAVQGPVFGLRVYF